MKPARDLTPIFEPRSVAVVGASREPHKLGHLVLKNIINGGYQGKIFAVNPKVPEILGINTRSSLLEVEDEIDLVIIVTPAHTIPDLMKQCVERRVKGAIIISGGFSEIGEEGKARQDTVLKIARQAGIPILGPNCQGVSNPYSNFCASWPLNVVKGNVAVISQSGSVGAAVQCWAEQERIGLSKLIDPGIRADIDEVELIQYLANDPHTKVIALYTEGVLRGREFIATASRVSEQKPIVVLKGGRSAVGAKAVLSHTRSLAGRDEVYTGAFKQAGILRTITIEEFYDTCKALSMLKPPVHESVLLVTTSGGLAILGVDTSEDLGLPLAQLSEGAKKQLREKLSDLATISNPLDLADKGLIAQSYLDVADVVVNEPIGLTILIFGDPVEDGVRIVSEFRSRTNMPVVVTYLGGGELELRDRFKLQELGFPVYPSPERAVRAVRNLVEFESRKLARKSPVAE